MCYSFPVFHTHKKSNRYSQKGDEMTRGQVSLFHPVALSSSVAGVWMHYQLNTLIDYYCIVPKY